MKYFPKTGLIFLRKNVLKDSDVGKTSQSPITLAIKEIGVNLDCVFLGAPKKVINGDLISYFIPAENLDISEEAVMFLKPQKDKALLIEIARMDTEVVMARLTNETVRITFIFNEQNRNLQTHFEIENGEAWLKTNANLPYRGYMDLEAVTAAGRSKWEPGFS